MSCEMPVDWSPTFDSKDTIPFGTFVLRQELETLFPGSEIENIDLKTGDYMEKIRYEYRYDHYVSIYSMNHLPDSTWLRIVNYVNNGGSALISNAQQIPVFEKELGVKTVEFPYENEENPSVTLSVKNKNYTFHKGFRTSYFSNFNPETTEVLGYLTYQNKKKPNFIKVYHGHGYFLLHAEPFAFTNYHMLRENHSEYASQIFSYMENADILWDNHRINRRQSGESNDGGLFSALGFVLKHQALRWALFLMVAAGILYLIFNSKRKQKAVPVILPYSNHSLDFAKTLSELYRYNPDHTAMSKYKINFFLEQLKTHYNITSKDTEKDFSGLLSAKSGAPVQLCEKLVLTIDIFRNKNYLDKEDFYKLQTLIESFHQKSNLYGRKSTGK